MVADLFFSLFLLLLPLRPRNLFFNSFFLLLFTFLYLAFVYLFICLSVSLIVYRYIFFSLNYRIEKDRVNTGSSLSLPFSNSLSFTFFLNMYISRVYFSILIFLCVCMGVMVPSFRYICVISPCRAFNIVYLFFVFFLLFDVFLFFFLTIALPHLFAISSCAMVKRDWSFSKFTVRAYVRLGLRFVI